MAETREDVPDGLAQYTDVIPNPRATNGRPTSAVNPLAHDGPPSEDQDSEDQDLLKEYHFGIRSWHPQCLQILANKKFFLFMLCTFALLQGAIISGTTKDTNCDTECTLYMYGGVLYIHVHAYWGVV